MEQPKQTVIYVTREIERAMGMAPNEHYRIVANRTPYGETIKKQYPDFVTLVESPTPKLLGTGELLDHPKTAAVYEEIANSFITPAKATVQDRSADSPVIPAKAGIQGQTTGNGNTLDSRFHGNDKTIPNFLVFKNTARIEPIAHAHGWKLVNPLASLSEQVENKISQVAWLENSAEYYLPKHQVGPLKRMTWTGEPFVLQWGHGHTGDGTILVNSQAELDKWKARFPYRMTRVSALVSGPSFTVNALVAGDDVLIGNPSYQITGMAPFTDSRFATVGNDWSAVRNILSEAELRSIENLAKDIGMRLKDSGWRGLYGVDIMRDDERGRIFLIEVNARQPASTPFESFLQESERVKGAAGLTIFEAHLKALLGEAITEPLIKIKDGSQIIQRVTNAVRSVPANAASALESAGYQVVSYANTELNADLLRIQSMNGIMAGHDVFNEKGKEIVKIVSSK